MCGRPVDVDFAGRLLIVAAVRTTSARVWASRVTPSYLFDRWFPQEFAAYTIHLR